jgi:hypothetical protein
MVTSSEAADSQSDGAESWPAGAHWIVPRASPSRAVLAKSMVSVMGSRPEGTRTAPNGEASDALTPLLSPASAKTMLVPG